MIKHNKKIKMFLSTFIIVLSFWTLNVYADDANVSTNIDCPDGDNVCLQNAQTCLAQLKDEYKLNVTKSKDKTKLIVKIDAPSDKKFNVNVYDIDYGQRNYKASVELKGGESYEVNADVRDTISYSYTIESLLVSSASVGSGDEKVECSKKYWQTKELKNTVAASTKVKNPAVNSDGVCTLYLNGTLTKDKIKKIFKTEEETESVNSYTKLLGDNQFSYSKLKTYNSSIDGASYFKKLVPYCFKSEVDEIFNSKSVLDQIMRAGQVIYNKHILYNNSSKTIENHSDFIDLSDFDLSKTVSLTCDAFGVKSQDGSTYLSQDNVRKFKKTTPSDWVTVDYSYQSNVQVCRTQCTEEVIVTYGPPVSVKAGMCFEYEVEIESKVTCKPEEKPNAEPQLQESPTCSYSVDCENNEYRFDSQAGPNQEFDSCINSCDGGKYSQSCINSCYKKVYKKSSNKVNLALAYNPIKKVAGEPLLCNPTSYLATSGNTIQSLINDVCWYYNNGDSHGDYQMENGHLKWVPSDECHWSKYASVYLSNAIDVVGIPICERTVRDDLKVMSSGRWWDRSTTGYYPNNGIKTAYYNDSTHGYGVSCNEYCEIKSNGCSNNGVGSVTSQDQANFDADLEKYNSAIQQCNASVVCKTDKASYKMSVNNIGGSASICAKNGSKNESDCIVWNDDSKKNECEYNSKNQSSKTNLDLLKTAKDGCKNLNKGQSIIREISGVCTGINNDDEDYRSIISFPGTWIRNKGGKRYYKQPDNENYYQYVPGKYCLPLTASNVNKDWWLWDQKYLRSSDKINTVSYTSTTDSTGTTYNKYNGIYNIFAKIEKFGYFEWNVDVSCFFADYNSEPVCNGTNCSTPEPCTGKDCNNVDNDTNGVINSETRAAALDDLFPTTDATTEGVKNDSTKTVAPTKLGNKVSGDVSVTKVADTTTTNKNEPGYNWTCDATNLLIKNYPIAPTALIQKIQSVGDNVFNDKNELDYQVVLTTSNIKNIRNYNKSKQYTDYGSESYKSTNNINFYKSKFLSDSKYISKLDKPSGVAALCNNVKNRNQCDVDFIRNDSSCPKLISERSSIGL